MSVAAIRFAVLTVSDRCARGEMVDTAGPALAEILSRELGAEAASTAVVPDEQPAIEEALARLVSQRVDLVISTGGTGCAPRDVTPDATRAVIDREVPGLAEAMRAASAAITPMAWLSRGVCGIAATTLIVNLPGSRKGAIENLRAIIGVLPHALEQIRGMTAHPDADAGREREA